MVLFPHKNWLQPQKSFIILNATVPDKWVTSERYMKEGWSDAIPTKRGTIIPSWIILEM